MMKTIRLLTIAVASFALLVAGCSSQKGAEKGDETKTQQQAQSKEESEEGSEEKSEEGSEEKAGKEGKEHPGEEHPGEGKGKKKGEEHPGEGKGKKKGHKKGKEHPGDEHPGEGEEEGEEDEDEEEEEEEEEGEEESSKTDFTADDIKTAMRKHIDANSDGGVFTIEDNEAGETLELKFVKIHDPVREMTEKGSYFGCTDFHVKGNEDKIYDLDFWLKPKGDSLEVVRSKVHKHPTKKNGEWVKEARYTFKNNEIAKIE